MRREIWMVLCTSMVIGTLGCSKKTGIKIRTDVEPTSSARMVQAPELNMPVKKIQIPATSLADGTRNITLVNPNKDAVPVKVGQSCRQHTDCGQGGVCMESVCKDSWRVSCTTNLDCPDYELCVNGKCMMCQSDVDCKTGYVCNPNKICEQADIRLVECQSVQDCGNGETCVDGLCTRFCNDDIGCKSGFDCKRLSNVRVGLCERGKPCEPSLDNEVDDRTGELCYAMSEQKIQRCVKDSDCMSEGLKCENNRCVGCTEDRQCRLNNQYTCEDSVCVVGGQKKNFWDGFRRIPSCKDHKDCEGYCSDGHCESCDEDSQCGKGNKCVDDKCIECVKDADCKSDPGHPVCIDSKCRSCKDNSMCPSDEYCSYTHQCLKKDNRTCKSDSDCGENGKCVRGEYCMDKESIYTVDIQCATDEHCGKYAGMKCISKWTLGGTVGEDNQTNTCSYPCQTDDDCLLQACVNGVCANALPLNPCKTSTDCAQGYECRTFYGECTRIGGETEETKSRILSENKTKSLYEYAKYTQRVTSLIDCSRDAQCEGNSSCTANGQCGCSFNEMCGEQQACSFNMGCVCKTKECCGEGFIFHEYNIPFKGDFYSCLCQSDAACGDGKLCTNDWKCVADNDDIALLEHGRYHEYGLFGFEQNYQKAAEYYRKATDNGSLSAPILLGRLIALGLGVEQDVELGTNLVKAGMAILEDPQKTMPAEVKKVLEIAPDDMKSLIQKHAKSLGNDAWFEIALMYFKGEVLPLDPQKGQECLKKLKGRDEIVQYLLAKMYYEGNVLQKDLKNAEQIVYQMIGMNRDTASYTRKAAEALYEEIRSFNRNEAKKKAQWEESVEDDDESVEDDDESVEDDDEE